MKDHSKFGCRTSVLILSYNHEKYISKCIESIISSKFFNYHIWILDDGSTDGTISEISKFLHYNNITLVVQENSGGNTSKNSQRLIDESDGEYIIFMSGDDLFGSFDSIARGVARLQAEPDLAVIFPRMVYLMQDPAQVAPVCHEAPLLAALRTGNPREIIDNHLYKMVSRIFLQGMVIRRDVVTAIGGFDIEMVADDYAFIMRLFAYLREAGRSFLFDEESFWLYRVHETNMHRNPVRQFGSIAQVTAKYLPRNKWSEFSWDGVVFREYGQWIEARQMAIQIFGAENAFRVLRPALIATLKTAKRRRDILTIVGFLRDKENNLYARYIALKYFIHAVANMVFQGSRR